MLAAARSEDGKDDAVVHYVDTIKAMSARQLELHYVIYRTWQTLLNQEASAINVAQSTEIHGRHIFINGVELAARKLPYDLDLTVLYRLGLLHQFKYSMHIAASKTMPFIDVCPTTFGVMLFAVAHNKIEVWRSFHKNSYESAAGIQPLNYFGGTFEQLCLVSGIPSKESDA